MLNIVLCLALMMTMLFAYKKASRVANEENNLSEKIEGAKWLTPVYASPMGDNGYDVSDYYSINPLYGTMKDMDGLIEEANDRGIKIVMDLVFNHTSNECEWFKESSNDRTNDKNDWYIWKDPLPDDENIFAYVRESESGKAIVLVNLSGNEVNYDETLLADNKEVISSYGNDKIDTGKLKPYEAKIVLY